jgi:hypothetical protein
MFALCASLATASLAHEGHDHGDADKAPPIVGNQPQRLADGTVFIPKSAQRGVGVLTLKASQRDGCPFAGTARPGDHGSASRRPRPGHAARAHRAGRAHGLPAAGSRVKKGEVLAWVVPASGAIERSNQAAATARSEGRPGLAEKRLARLRDLADTVPQRKSMPPKPRCSA